MTRAKVTRIVRIVFFFWAVVSIALGLTTIATLLPLPDQHEYGEAGSGLTNGDRQSQSLLPPGRSASTTSPNTIQHWPGAWPRREYTIPDPFFSGRPCPVIGSFQDLVTTLKRITKGDSVCLLRLTSTLSTAHRALLVTAVNLKDLQRPRFGIRVAFSMVDGKTAC